jgi:hypothetical protein
VSPAHRLLAFSALLGTSSLGCGSDTTALPATPDAGAEPSPAAQRVVLGSGVRAFEPLDNDAHATLIAGPQGAYHVWTSFLSYGFDTDVLRMSLSTGWDDTPGSVLNMPGRVSAKPTLDPQGQSALATVGWPALILDPLCQNGRALRVDLTVSDDAGHSASDTRRWILDIAEEYRSSECDVVP